MSFPLECVGPICDAFLLRTKSLLMALLGQDPSNHAPGLVTRAHFSILTLNLMIQKNCDAVLYIRKTLAQPYNSFFKVTFKFLLGKGGTEEESLADVIRILCECIGAIFRCNSTVVNDFALQEILGSLQFMQSTTIKVVHPSIMDIVIGALHLLCTEWSAQHKATQQKALALLKWLLDIDCLQLVTAILCKSLVIQLHLLVNHESSLGREVALDSEQVKSLLTCLSSCTSDQLLFHSTEKAMQAIGYLVRYIPNKEALVDGGIIDRLADIIESGCSEQQYAAELVCFIMDESEPNLQFEQPIPTRNTNSYHTESEIEITSTDVENLCSDYQASEVIKILFPLALNCFKDFMSACGQQQEAEASLQLMYTSTLIQLVLNVFCEEESDDQIRIVDILACLPGAPSSLIAMLWGSSVVLPLDPFQLPPTTWIGTFFDIQKCLILWTDLSERFCNALLEAGLIHFMDTEFDRLKEVVLNLARLPHHDLLINQVHSILAILYNCVQKVGCLPTILSTVNIEDTLTAFTLSPNFDTKILSKFILSFLLPVLTNQHQELLVLKHDEVKFLLDSLSNASQSPDLEAGGYSASELLQVLLNFSKCQENHTALIKAKVYEIIESYLKSYDSNCQKFSLQIVWNFLSFNVQVCDREKDIRLSSSCDTIRNMAVDVQIQSLHQSILFLLENREDADVSNLLAYAKTCFQYQKYWDCIDSSDRIQTMDRNCLKKIVVNEAKLLKGKSLFYTYQREQKLFLKYRGSLSTKEAEDLKQKCYQKTRECIIILGSLFDCGYLDEEGSRLLDFAMIDYMRETNCLNSCRRCLLCRNKAVLRRSHLFSKFILKAISKDLVVESDHKVFIPMIGKAIKKSSGEVTFWMLCSDCEERLCQNGEQQFAEQIYKRVCINRQVVQSKVVLPYSSWLYDFCMGVFFRGLAISDELNIFNTNLALYKLFVGCRQHLLTLSLKRPSSKVEESLNANVISEKLPSCLPLDNMALDKLAVSVFVNPLVNASRYHQMLSCFNFVLKAPAIFVSPITLDTAVLSHVREKQFFLVHFDCLNILIQWQPQLSTSASTLPTIELRGGELIIPEEHRRWQVIPSGIWKLFSALCQAKEEFSRAKSVSKREVSDGSGKHLQVTSSKPGFVYPPKSTIFLDKSVTISCLPRTFSVISNDEVVIKVPHDHRVLMCTAREWGYGQKITFYVTECVAQPYVVFVLRLPGFIIMDGISFDPHALTVKLPFLDKKCAESHPLTLPVLHNLITNFQELMTFFHVWNQLS